LRVSLTPEVADHFLKPLQPSNNVFRGWRTLHKSFQIAIIEDAMLVAALLDLSGGGIDLHLKAGPGDSGTDVPPASRAHDDRKPGTDSFDRWNSKQDSRISRKQRCAIWDIFFLTASWWGTRRSGIHVERGGDHGE
jgi:hypothetical protein